MALLETSYELVRGHAAPRDSYEALLAPQSSRAPTLVSSAACRVRVPPRPQRPPGPSPPATGQRHPTAPHAQSAPQTARGPTRVAGGRAHPAMPMIPSPRWCGEPRIAQPREPCERALPRSGRDVRAHVASRTTCTRLPLRLRDAPNSWPSTVPRPTRATTHADARRPTDGGRSMPRGGSRAGRAAAAGAAEPRPPGAPHAPIAAGHGGPLVVFSRVAGGDRLTALDSTRDTHVRSAAAQGQSRSRTPDARRGT